MNYRIINTDIITSNNYLKPQFNPSNDEYFIDISAYHAQQAVEKILKFHLFENYGINEKIYSYRTHDILSLINNIDKFDKNFKIKNKDLVVMADEITSWAVKTRYGKSYLGTVESCLKIAERLFDELLTDLFDYKKRYRIGCNGYTQLKKDQVERILDKLMSKRLNIKYISQNKRINIVNDRIMKLENIKNNESYINKLWINCFRFKNKKITEKFDLLLTEEKGKFLGYTTLSCKIFSNKDNIKAYDEWISKCLNFFNKDFGPLNFALAIDLDYFRLYEEISVNDKFDVPEGCAIVSIKDDIKYYNKDIEIDKTQMFKNLIKRVKHALAEHNNKTEDSIKLKRKFSTHRKK